MLKDPHANIFNDLATLTEAGISILDAARRVAASHLQMKAWSDVITMLERGNKLSLALGKNGLISRYEQEVISVAESG
jgi:type II secretory pathway component PulF